MDENNPFRVLLGYIIACVVVFGSLGCAFALIVWIIKSFWNALNTIL
jgi:hypothetical protein